LEKLVGKVVGLMAVLSSHIKATSATVERQSLLTRAKPRKRITKVGDKYKSKYVVIMAPEIIILDPSPPCSELGFRGLTFHEIYVINLHCYYKSALNALHSTR
jgi:hypothetical protein